VPAALITRLLAEKPQVARLAVPGMPVGFPGMEVGGMEPDTYRWSCSELGASAPSHGTVAARGLRGSGAATRHDAEA